MNLLLDENISRRLVQKLADLFPDIRHVAHAGLLQADDFTIWDYAKSNGFCILTADADFYELATASGPPPKVIWLWNCDYPTNVAEVLIRSQAIRIGEFLEDSERAVLILRRT